MPPWINETDSRSSRAWPLSPLWGAARKMQASQLVQEGRKTRVYIAGPMRGIPTFNFPAFAQAAFSLRELGFEVISPHEMDLEQDKIDYSKHADFTQPPHGLAHYMARDLKVVCEVDALAMLQGWEKSEGARLEVYVARAVGKQIVDAVSLFPIVETVPTCGVVGIGGAPIRASTLPEGGSDRKQFPIASGFMDYFPDAIVAIANVSHAGNEQHNPGKPLHWDRSKSGDEADTMQRHFLQRGQLDTDGKRHTAKMAWRALAILQKEIESEAKR